MYWLSNRNALRISLFSLLVTGFLLLFVNGSSHPALDVQIDDHDSPTLVSVDGSGDSSSPESSPFLAFLVVFPEGESRAGISSSLHFIQPPQRLLSYPELPQGPPALV